jgi:ER lumen protein retaining receptor
MLNTFPDHVFYLLAEATLLIQLRMNKTALGLSVQSQELFLIVYVTRYLDVLDSHSSTNSALKLGCIVCTALLIAMVRGTEPYKSSFLTYQADSSQGHAKTIVLSCGVVTLLTYLFFGPINFIETCWVFSVLLETLAMVPQILLLHRHGETDGLPASYMFVLAVYRGLFVLNYIYRALYDRYFDKTGLIEHLFAATHTVIYCAFFGIYIRA